MKCYQFDFIGTISGYGTVEAKSLKEAKTKILNGEYDDIIDNSIQSIDEITGIDEITEMKELE